MSEQGGRPRKIESPERMDELVQEFWDKCVKEDRPITLTGLIWYLGLSSRQSLDEYANYEGFSDSVKRAKLIVERAYEERLHENSPTGAIFALKNMGWSDRQDLDLRSPDGSMSAPQRIEIVPGKANDEEADG